MSQLTHHQIEIIAGLIEDEIEVLREFAEDFPEEITDAEVERLQDLEQLQELFVTNHGAR